MSLLCRVLCLLLAATATLARADDLWQIDSSTSTPGGPALTHRDTQCLPGEGMDPARVVPAMENCRFLQKSGTAAALRFVLECRLAGMPPELGAIHVAGDARLSGDHFDMRYAIDMGAGGATPGSDLTMSGALTAQRLGSCAPH